MNVLKIALFESHYHIRSVRHRENSSKLSYYLLQSYNSKLQLHLYTNSKFIAFIISPFALLFFFLFQTASAKSLDHKEFLLTDVVEHTIVLLCILRKRNKKPYPRRPKNHRDW